jgi:Mn-dependent DtxR family transcriptional regulator
MNDLAYTLLIAAGLFIGLPTAAYMVSKLATLGYLKAKQKFEEDNHQPNKGE